MNVISQKKLVRRIPKKWFPVNANVFESGELAEMNGGEIRVYLIIEYYCKFYEGKYSPTVNQIAKKVGLSPRRVQQSTASLTNRGLLQVERRGRNNIYKIIR